MFQSYAPLLNELTQKFINIKLTDFQLNQFCLFGDLLLSWNERMNLTRITDPYEVILKHFIDSMVIAKYITGTNFADLGTGAGFPGVPLKIIRPELNVFLIDSLKKRLDFLSVVAQELSLKNVMTVHARAEDFGRNNLYRGYFDAVSSRAMARLPILLEYALPLLKINGVFPALKGAQVDNELQESQKALRILGGKIKDVEYFDFGDVAEHRAVVLITKIKETPLKYPRKAGTPVKSPII